LPVRLLAGHPWQTGKAKQDLTLPDGIKSKLEDLPLQASASLTFKAGDGGSSAFAGTIKIPDLGQKLRSLQVGGADSSIAFTVGNQSGFSLNSVEANIEEISLSPDDFPGREFSFKDVHLKYSKVPEGSLWEASGVVHLPFMINNGPIRTDWSLLGGVQILNGTLVGMKLGAQDLNRYIGEGFFLQRLSGEITTLDDWVIKLEGAGTLGPKIPDFPEPPFAIDPASVAVGEATKCDKGDLAMEAAVTGQIAKAYKGLKGSIGGQYCLNFDNPSSSIAADIDLGLVKGDVELAHAKGTVKGWFAGAQTFNIEGSGNVSIGKITTGGKFVLSDYGAAVCSKFLFFSGGVGYRYSIDSWPHLFEGCDIGPWRSPAAAAAAVGDSRVTVPAGLPFAGFQVTGAGGVPRISLRAPGGHTIVTGMEAVNSPQVVAVPSESDSTVYLFVNKPQAGTWTVSAEPGSVAITSVKTARGLRQPVVGAHVSKRGTGSVLRWHLTPLPGQRVTFYEQGAHFTRLLTGTTAARGMKRFTPMRGRTGRRTIVAVVTQDGLPRTRMEVAHFNYRLVPLAAPRGLKASRKGSLLRASWHPVPGATRYLAEVRAGKSVLARQLVRSSGLRAPALAGVTLSVRALDSLGSAGKARVVRVR
jgi:hypothetical protein